MGVTTGAATSLALTKTIAALLFGVKPLDAATFAIVAIMIATVSVAACYVPARRATDTDPLAALRHE